MEHLTVYLSILTAVSILAPFGIEAIKKILGDKKYNVNTLSAVTTAVIALLACAAYLVAAGVKLTATHVIYVTGTIFFSVLGALCGYDKIFKAVFEIFKKGE